MLIDQHQQAGLLHGAFEHELKIGGADLIVAGWFKAFRHAIAAQVGRQMQKETAGQALLLRLIEQALQQLMALQLQLLKPRCIAAKMGNQHIDVERGRHPVVEHGPIDQRVLSVAIKFGQQRGENLMQPVDQPRRHLCQKRQLCIAHAGMADPTLVVLQLHPACRQSRQIEPLSCWIHLRAKGALHQTVHPQPARMFTIGEHAEAITHRSNRTHVARIQTPGEWIAHQRHGHTIEILHQQKVGLIHQLAMQIRQRKTGHGACRFGSVRFHPPTHAS